MKVGVFNAEVFTGFLPYTGKKPVQIVFEAVDDCVLERATTEVATGEHFVVSLPDRFESCGTVAVQMIDLRSKHTMYRDQFVLGQDFLHSLGTIQGDVQLKLRDGTLAASTVATALQIGALSLLCTVALIILVFGALIAVTKAKAGVRFEPGRHQQKKVGTRHEGGIAGAPEPPRRKGGAQRSSMRQPVSNPYVGSDSRDSADDAGLKRTVSLSTLLFSSDPSDIVAIRGEAQANRG